MDADPGRVHLALPSASYWHIGDAFTASRRRPCSPCRDDRRAAFSIVQPWVVSAGNDLALCGRDDVHACLPRGGWKEAIVLAPHEQQGHGEAGQLRRREHVLLTRFASADAAPLQRPERGSLAG